MGLVKDLVSAIPFAQADERSNSYEIVERAPGGREPSLKLLEWVATGCFQLLDAVWYSRLFALQKLYDS